MPFFENGDVENAMFKLTELKYNWKLINPWKSLRIPLKIDCKF